MSKKAAIAKVEIVIKDLVKMDQSLKEHLAKIRSVPGLKDTAKAIANKLFVDTMVPGMGNRAAFEDFMSRPRKGVHISLDLNSLKHVNSTYGQVGGDEAIKTMGHAIRRASRANRLKSWHISGDEYRLHADDPDQAHRFLRHLRAEFEKLPPMKGVHKLSASVGLGQSPEHADTALIHAKTAKKAAGHPPGQEHTHIHSLLPGAAGPVPHDPDHQLNGFLKQKATKLKSDDKD